MKNKVLAITWTIAILAGLLMFSCKNRVREDEAGGTIGKVSKFRKDQMSEKDILLRSDIVQDTSKLSGIIEGLVLFNAYTANLEQSIADRLLDIESIRGFDEQYDRYITELTDFKDFLKNNNEVLYTTVFMLCDFYKDTISESSADVENNLRAFVNYVQKLEEKDSILTVMVNNLDTYMEANEQQIVDKQELDKLRGIRDEMLIRVVQQAYVFNDPSALKAVEDKVISNIAGLSAVYDAVQLSNAVGSAWVGAVANTAIGSYTLGGQGGLGSTTGGNGGTGGAGGGALPPVHPPSDPTGAGFSGLQNFVLFDQGILQQIQSLSSNEVLSSVVNGLVIGSSAVGSQGAISNIQTLDGLVVGSAILSAQDFLGSSALQGIPEQN